MKRILSVVLVLFMSVGMSGCSLLLGQLDAEARQPKDREYRQEEKDAYREFMLKRLTLEREYGEKMLSQAKNSAKLIKNKEAIAEIENDSAKYISLYEDVSSYSLDNVPTEYKESHKEYVMGIEAYKDGQLAFAKYIKTGDKKYAEEAAEYLTQGDEHMKKGVSLEPGKNNDTD